MLTQTHVLAYWSITRRPSEEPRRLFVVRAEKSHGPYSRVLLIGKRLTEDMVGVGWVIDGVVCPVTSWVHLGYEPNLDDFCEFGDFFCLTHPNEKG